MASIKFKKAYLGKSVTVSSSNEEVETDYKIESFLVDDTTSEDTEVSMEKAVLKDLTKNKDIDLVIGSDLSNHMAITNETMSSFDIPFFGVYNACSSYVEGLVISATLLHNSTFKNIVTLVSSHNLGAERTFRYPIEYGSPRKITQTFTATGTVGTVVTKNETNIKLESCTIGKVIDYGITDVNNMGAVMAPSAALTLVDHLKELKRDVSYYDLILTGDLGKLGAKMFKEILSHNNITLKHYTDAGSILITDTELTDQGASGPACLPLILVEKVLKQKNIKKF